MIATPSGRYRFRKGWLGLTRVLQAEWIGDWGLMWKDESRRAQVPERMFAIMRHGDWLASRERIALADKRAAQARASRAKKKPRSDFVASEFLK